MSKTSRFAEEVIAGLQSSPKQLPSKYFYDAKGDQLFQEIMNMPEYYLTNCEYEIFNQQKQQILDAFDLDAFDLIELGAGDGYKTKVLLAYFQQQQVPFRYIPIDISQNVLDQLAQTLKIEIPDLNVIPHQGEYRQALAELSRLSKRPKVVLFLGGNIGNLRPQKAQTFLESLRDVLNPGDELMIGFDLKKDPQVILDAYNDPAGITSRFNLNLLTRINRELNANFQVDQFRHWETYNPVDGAARSFIVSTADQQVRLGALNTTIEFDAWEAIEVELSQKYDPKEILELAQQTGFQHKQNFFDSKRYFVDSLWTFS